MLGIKFFAWWLEGNKFELSNRLKIRKVIIEATTIGGSNLMLLFFQKEEKSLVFSSVKKMTKPLIIKKKLTPKYPYWK